MGKHLSSKYSQNLFDSAKKINHRYNRNYFKKTNPNSQLKKLKSAINGDDKTNFRHKLLLTNRQVENLRKAFPNKPSTEGALA